MTTYAKVHAYYVRPSGELRTRPFKRFNQISYEDLRDWFRALASDVPVALIDPLSGEDITQSYPWMALGLPSSGYIGVCEELGL